MKRKNCGDDTGKSIDLGQYLLMDWIKCVLEESKQEEYNIHWPTQLLCKDTRKAVWCLADLLNTNLYSNAIEVQACRLLEQYLAVKFKNNIQSAQLEDHDVDSGHWKLFKRDELKDLPLHIVSCIQLASKMSHSGAQFSVKNIRNQLKLIGARHSDAEIREAEFEVFKTLGFRLPMWSTLDSAELFAKQIGFPCCEDLHIVVNFVELTINVIEDRLRDVVKVQSFTGVPALRPLHIAAASVATCARIMANDIDDVLTQLTAIISAPPLFLKCLTDVIVKLSDDVEKGFLINTDVEDSDEEDKKDHTEDNSDDVEEDDGPPCKRARSSANDSS